MIDTEARTRLAEAIRALSAGLISNDEFEMRVPLRSPDPALREVFLSGPWQLYSDLHAHKLVGRYRLPKLGRPEVARWVLFLKSDRPYEWPLAAGLLSITWLVLTLLTLGLARRVRRRLVARVGDISVWPFLKSEHFEEALRDHPYLRGAA